MTLREALWMLRVGRHIRRAGRWQATPRRMPTHMAHHRGTGRTTLGGY